MSRQLQSRNEAGQTMAEYGVVLGLLTLTTVTVVGVLGTAFEARVGSVAALIAGLV